MFKPKLLSIAVLGAAIGVAGAAQAANSFDPLAPCSVALAEGSDVPALAVGFWAFGFLDAATGEAHEVNVDRLNTMIDVLTNECRNAPGTRMYDLATRLAQSQTDNNPDVAEAGRDLLMRFFDPNEDLRALTASLKPAAADIRAVYAEPLASALIASYEQMYTPDAVIQPKPEHKQLLTTFTTTGHLKAGDPVLDEFPGGYKDVLDYFVADVPIGRFKFVEPGETLGLAFDGLIFVNNRWVFMPKPWRALEQ